MTEKEIIAEAVKRAQEAGRKKGFKAGDIVAHPNFKYTFRIGEIQDGRVTIVLPPGHACKNPPKDLPLSEIFDPNVAQDLLLEVVFGDLSETPGQG